MEALKRKRSALAGAVTRIFNKFQKALTEDPDTLDIGQLEHQIDSIKISDASYCKVHEEISDSYIDEINAEEELFILEQHEEAMCKTLSLIIRLIDVHTVYSVSMELQQRVEDLERKQEDSPHKSFEQAIKKVEEDYQKLQTTVRRSTIPHTHRIRQLVSELNPRVLDPSSTDRQSSSLDISSSSDSSLSLQVKLPKLSLPTFKGYPKKWAVFWEQFNSVVHFNTHLDNAQKLTYLRESIKDPKAIPLLFRATTTSSQYDDLISLLKDRYDQRRLIPRTHTMAIVECPSLKQGSHEELCSFMDTLEHNINSLKDARQYNIGSFLTSILSSKLTKRLQESWLHFSRDDKEVPDIFSLIRFLKERIHTTPVSASAPVKTKAKPEAPKRYKALIHQLQPQWESRESCTVCGGEGHPIYCCPTFNSMSIDSKNAHVRSNHLCFNCLSSGHRTKDCRTFRWCRKCGRTHHTSLHRDVVVTPPAEASVVHPTAEQGNAATVNAAAPVSHIEPTLQVTSQVILESPDGKQLLARALLDPGASISLVARRVVQQLQLKKHLHKLSPSWEFKECLQEVVFTPPHLPSRQSRLFSLRSHLPLQ